MAKESGSTGTTPEIETDPKNILQQQIIQAKNAQALADERYKKDPTAENGRARLDALFNTFDLYLKQAEMDGNVEAINLFAKIRPALAELAKKARINLADQAGKHNQDLQKSLSEKQITLMNEQAQKLFDLDVMGQKTTVSLLAIARGFAALLKAFGVDTTEFMAACDEGMKQARASIAEIDYKALAKPSIKIDPSAGQKQVRAAEAATTGEIEPEINALRALLTKVEGVSVAPSIKTADAIAVVGASGLDPKQIQRANRDIGNASQKDGNTSTLSELELLEINKRMLVITGSQAATEKIMAGIRQTAAPRGPIETVAESGPR